MERNFVARNNNVNVSDGIIGRAIVEQILCNLFLEERTLYRHYALSKCCVVQCIGILADYKSELPFYQRRLRQLKDGVGAVIFIFNILLRINRCLDLQRKTCS